MTRLNTIKEGTGPVIVLSHALGCDLGMWEAVAAELKQSFCVLRFDQRGHGKSEVPPAPYSMEALADDVAELIASQAGGAAHFVGLSMGGMVAQQVAVRHPQRVRSLVIANSSASQDAASRAMWQARAATVLDQGVAAIAEGSMQRWFTPEFRAQHPDQVAAMRKILEATDPKGYAATCDAISRIDFRSSNAGIACPALVIAGSRDQATPPAMSEEIRASIPGSRMATLDAAHLSAVERPAEFARLVADFVGAL